jgi:hypothetical protein
MLKKIGLVIMLVAAALFCVGCGGGGGSDAGPVPIDNGVDNTVGKPVVITGIVPGTIAEALNASGEVVSSSTASGSPKRFNLIVKTNSLYSIRFIENEGTAQQRIYNFYNTNGSNNFSFPSGGITIDMGVLTFNDTTGRATPSTDVFAGTGAAQTVVATPDMSGLWDFTMTLVESTCGASPGRVETSIMSFVQTSNSILITNVADGHQFYGTISGGLFTASDIYQWTDSGGNTVFLDIEGRGLFQTEIIGQIVITETRATNICTTVNNMRGVRK